MFSPLNDTQVEEWFQRFNAPLKRLPAEERANLHLEVRQHLESLATAKMALGQPEAAAWESALGQFGAPEQIGRKMYYEWRQTHSWSRSDIAAILCVIGLNYVLTTFMSYLTHLLLPDHSYHEPQSIARDVIFLEWFGVPVTIGLIIGRQYPLQALKATLYGMSLASISSLIWMMRMPLRFDVQNAGFIGAIIFFVILRIFISAGAAYLACVTKRGWYRPTWVDFKITLPQRRPRLIH